MDGKEWNTGVGWKNRNVRDDHKHLPDRDKACVSGCSGSCSWWDQGGGRGYYKCSTGGSYAYYQCGRVTWPDTPAYNSDEWWFDRTRKQDGSGSQWRHRKKEDEERWRKREAQEAAEAGQHKEGGTFWDSFFSTLR